MCECKLKNKKKKRGRPGNETTRVPFLLTSLCTHGNVWDQGVVTLIGGILTATTGVTVCNCLNLAVIL